jgi:hypothetical protein
MPATFAYKKIVCSVLPDSAVSNHVLVLCTVIELYHSGLTASNAFFTVKGGKLITNLPRLHAVSWTQVLLKRNVHCTSFH